MVYAERYQPQRERLHEMCNHIHIGYRAAQEPLANLLITI